MSLYRIIEKRKIAFSNIHCFIVTVAITEIVFIIIIVC